MKKITHSMLVFFLLFSVFFGAQTTSVYGAGNDLPRVIISNVEVSGNGIAKGAEATLKLTLKNTNDSYAAYGVLLTASYNDEIYATYSHSNQAYIDSLNPGEEKSVELQITASDTLSEAKVLSSINISFFDNLGRTSNYDAQIIIPITEDGLSIKKIEVPESVSIMGKGRISLILENNSSNSIYNGTMKIYSDEKEIAATQLGTVSSGARINPEAYLSFEKTGEYPVSITLSYVDDAGNTIEKETQEYRLTVTDEENIKNDQAEKELPVATRNYKLIIVLLLGMAVTGVLVLILLFHDLKNR